MAYVESEQTKLSPEKEKKVEAAIKLLEEAVEIHENKLPDTLSAKEMDDLYQAADLYQECREDDYCQQRYLKFALDPIIEQISDRRKEAEQFLKIKPSPRDQGRSEQMKGWGASAEFKERYGSDPLKDLADLNRKYAGKPQMIETDEEKIRCYQTAKYLLQEIDHKIIRPLSKDKSTVAFAEAAKRELKDEVEALLAEREQLEPAA